MGKSTAERIISGDVPNYIGFIKYAMSNPFISEEAYFFFEEKAKEYNIPDHIIQEVLELREQNLKTRIDNLSKDNLKDLWNQ